MTKATALLALLLVLATGSHAGERGAAALDQALIDLSSDLRVVWVGAQPGDEDWATLAWLRRSLGVETRLILLTRGEGGQSETGSELGKELGELRERETRAAAALVGSSVEFLDLKDPGFAASREDAYRRWGEEETLRRLTRTIRRIRPHVLLVRAADGDGRRAAVASAVEKARRVAANTEVFPEEGEAWAPRRLFITEAPKKADFRVALDGVDPVRGVSFLDMGRAARAAQPSLGPAIAGTVRAYRLVAGEADDSPTSLLDGLPLPRPEWRSEAHRTGLREEILDRVLALKSLPEGGRPPDVKIDRAAALAQGIELILTAPERPADLGELCEVRVVLRNGGPRAVTFGAEKSELAPRSRVELPALTVTPKEASTTVAESVTVFLGPKAVPVELSATAMVSARPALELKIAPWGRVFRPATDPGDLEQEISRFWVEIVNHRDEVRKERLSLRIDGTDLLRVVDPGLVTVPAGGRRWVRIEIHGRDGLSDGLYRAVVKYGPAVVRDSIRVLDVRIVGDLNVGVVTTIGDDVVQFLHSVGIRPMVLTDADLIERDLSYFNTIYLGIRAHHARPVLAKVRRRLLAYVKGGGHLVVNYHRPEEWSASYAPFPLELGSVHVAEERARVTLEEPRHRIFNFPNRVRSRDFDGWRAERGLWLPVSWDRERYRVLLTSADRGDPPQPGLLLAKSGKGTYVYTSFTWFRQLRNLNPGAMKMIANVISYAWR